ncbi:MAG: serralysin [Actinomycetota bacterium]|jgi:hypothetical protein
MRGLRGIQRIVLTTAIAVATVVSFTIADASAISDVTPPVVTFTTPAQGANYAQNSTVLASYSCSDASGIAACVGTASNGAAIITQKLGVQKFFVSGYDNAGNKTKVERTYNVVDQTKPVINLNSPTQGATYAKNSFVAAQFSCYDTGGGIASCVGTVSNGSALPTGTTGAKSFTVTAKDLANNTTVKTVTYSVV